MVYRIRKMDWPDIEHIVEIDRQCFPTMLPPTSYKTEMINPMAHYFVIFDDASAPYILGFAGLWMMAGESHIINLAVRPSHRQLGLGEFLLVCIVEASIGLKAHLVTLEVRVSNSPAQALYEKYGFIKCGRRKAYYLDNREDAVIMTLDQPHSSASLKTLEILKTEYFLKQGTVPGLPRDDYASSEANSPP